MRNEQNCSCFVSYVVGILRVESYVVGSLRGERRKRKGNKKECVCVNVGPRRSGKGKGKEEREGFKCEKRRDPGVGSVKVT